MKQAPDALELLAPTLCARRGCRCLVEQVLDPRSGRLRGRRKEFCSARCRAMAWWTGRRRNPLHTSDSVEWYTPLPLFEAWSAEFGGFTLDPCAHPDAPIWPLVPNRFTLDDDGLSRVWAGRVYVNPPYGAAIGAWVAYAAAQVASGSAELVVCLVPARTDTAWWWAALDAGAEPRFLRGRIRFVDPSRTKKHGATFPSALLIFRRGPC